MPLDTSIPLQIAQAPQTQAINPMSIYTAMQERQTNALRAQALQQEMAKNALTMQYAAEDRRIAAAARAEAARKAAEDRANAAYLTNAIRGGYVPAKDVVMGPGTVQGSTPASFDENRVLNALYAKGNPALLTAYSNMQEQFGKQRKAEAEATGQNITNKGLSIKNIDAQLAQLNAGLERAASPEEVDALFDGSADAIRATGKTPDMSKATFRQLAAQVGFDAAKMQVAQGVMATQKHFNDMLTGQAGRSDVTQDAAGNQITIDRATGTAMPVTMVAPAGAPAAGAPAPVKAKMTPEQEKTALKNKEAAKGIDEATSILKDLIKPDSLLDQSTGSYLGSWADAAVRGAGFGATKGSQATAQLRVFADPILKMIPRFEGPQSDKDTQTYKEAAGMLADDTVPAADRRAAAKALLALFERRKGQFEQASGATAPSAAVNAAPSGFEGWGIKKVGE